MLIRIGSLIRIWLVSAVMLLPSVGWSAPLKFDSIYVFGDSLSDTGNVLLLTGGLGISPAVPPSTSPNATFYQGRFSNGPVAVEYLWQSLTGNNSATLAPSLSLMSLPRKAGISFAYGGSGSGQSNVTPGGFVVPGVLGQVDAFRNLPRRQSTDPKALYVIWTGANDYVLGLTTNPGVVVGNIVVAIQSLYALGARNFLVPNLPDLGLSPLVQASGSAPQLTLLTKVHNALLAPALDLMAASLPGARIVRLDVFALTEKSLASGAVVASPPALAYLFPSSGAEACLFVSYPVLCPDVDFNAPLPLPFLFWDAQHPTTLAHGAIGGAMLDALTAAYR
jgi:phospholipase/lecithinase/hemolysin